MSTKSATNMTSSSSASDAKNVVVSFSSDSDDDDKSSSSSSSSSSESSSESDAETTKLKSDKAPKSSPPPSTAETMEENDVETVSFTLSLSSTTRDETPPAVEVPENNETIERKTTTEIAAAAEAEEQRDEVKTTSRDGPRNSPDAVIKSTESDAGDAKKISTKKTTKTATKSSKAEATNDGNELNEAPEGKKENAAPVAEEKVIAQKELSTTSASDSGNAANAVTTSPPVSTAEIAEDDDVETVSFTLSLSAVTRDDSSAEETPKNEKIITTSQETKPRTAAAASAEDELKQTPKESTSNSPNTPIKPAEVDADDTKKKTSAKKTTKTARKSSKVEAVNGDEADTEKAAEVAEEKIVVPAEPPKKSAPVLEDTANVVNGEITASTKTVKKKPKKAAAADAAVEEKSTRKSNTKENTVAEIESPKMSTTNIMDEASNVVNGEVKTTGKTTKKKTVKKSATESETIPVTEKKENTGSAEEKLAAKETIQRELATEKTESGKAMPAAGRDADSSAAIEETKSASAKTAVAKKKTKKVSGDVGKSSGAQEDATVRLENFTANESSTDKQTDDAAQPKNSAECDAGNSAVETEITAQKTTSSGADKDADAPEPTSSDKAAEKKKKPKKAAASSSLAAAESEETTSNIDVIVTATGNADLLEKTSQDTAVSSGTDNAVAEPTVALSKEDSSVDDVKNSPSPIIPLIATNDEAELSNVVTLSQLDATGNEASTPRISAPVQVPSSTGKISTERKPEILNVTATTTDATVNAIATEDRVQDSKNEESDFSYRRKSMDDFIKRILAEAREEQQKRMGATTNSGTADNAELLDPEATTNDADKFGPTNKEASMLDRRLASTDRKRMQREELGEWTSKSTSLEDVDLDQDLAEIGRYFGKRTASKYDVELDNNGEWNGSSRVRDVRQLEVDSGKAVVNGDEGRRPQQSNGLSENSFVPRAREETAELVRNSSRPVRAIVDQQTDVVQLLKSTARGIDDLESEIRSLRATFLDRNARIETFRSAVDAEVRAYNADQQAANDRIQQQQIPGGHFVRDEFMRANNIGPRDRSSAIDELLGGAAPRRRSGSVSSTSGIVTGTVVPSGMSSTDLDYKSSALNSWVMGARSSATDQPRRQDFDDDASSTASGYSITRYRRGGSVARERSFFATSEDPMMRPPRMETSRSYLLPTYDTSSPSGYSFGETSMRSTITYAPLQTSASTRSYYQPDYGPSSTATSPYYGWTDTGSYYGGSGGGGDLRSYGYSSLGGNTATNDPSRFRRAQSVSDFTSERSLSSDRAYNSAISSPSGQFQSRFLERVRARKAYGDDQYKSRFLTSDSGSSVRYSTRRNYSSDD